MSATAELQRSCIWLDNYVLAGKIGRSLSPSYGLIKWLTYQNRIRTRVLWEVDDQSITIIAPSLGIQYTSLLAFPGRVKTCEEVAIEAFAYFCSRFVLHQGNLRERHNIEHAVILAEMQIDLYHAPNWVKIPACFRGPNPPLVNPNILRPVSGLPQFVKLYDWWFFNKVGVDVTYQYLMQHVFLKAAQPWWDNSTYIPWDQSSMTVLSLKDICLRYLSTYNRAFAGSRFGPNVLLSTDKLYENNKLVKMMQKYGRDVANPPDPSPENAKDMAHGYSMMVVANGWDEHMGRISFVWDPTILWYGSFSLDASAGKRPGPTIKKHDNGVEIIDTPNGKKQEQMRYAMSEILRMVDEYREEGTMTIRDNYATIVAKIERFSAFGCKSAEDYFAKSMKCREYFILFLTVMLVAYIIHGDRQKFERGKFIKVGMKWAHGGAMKFASDISCKFMDGIILGDLDIDGYDTRVHRVFLELYCAHARYYIADDSPDLDLFLAFLKINIENLTVKNTLLFGRIWRIIIGTMPSGAFETSHGNSWIFTLLWFCFLAHQMSLHPEKADRLYDLVFLYELIMAIYGDDSVFVTHESVYDVFNIWLFVAWLLEAWGVVARDVRDHVPLLSIPSEDGNVSVKGVVFLKRCLIQRPSSWPTYLPAILPYKLWDDTWLKLIWGNAERSNLVDLAIASIGLAWDSMGTNPRIFDFCRRMHAYAFMAGGFKSNEHVLNAYLTSVAESDGNLDKLLRKMNIKVEHIARGFPTMDDLMELHTYDEAYIHFQPVFRRYEIGRAHV